MKVRHMLGGAAFAPDVLKVIFNAFDDAWAEIAAEVTARASGVETARLSLATIVLSLAKAGTIERDALKTAAVDAFRSKHRVKR